MKKKIFFRLIGRDKHFFFGFKIIRIVKFQTNRFYLFSIDITLITGNEMQIQILPVEKEVFLIF
jgi:hypothetical protein